MDSKKFHISDVLSITTKRMVSTREMEGIFDILNFMSGAELFLDQLPEVRDKCAPYLLEQFPQLDTPQMQFAVGELSLMLKTPSGRKWQQNLILGWISKLTSGQYGVKCDEILEVTALPKGVVAVINPLTEIQKMMENEGIIFL